MKPGRLRCGPAVAVGLRLWCCSAALLAPAAANSGAAAEGCLPADLSVRVELEPPQAIAARIRELASAGRRQRELHAALRDQLAAAGCETLEESELPELRTPNLECTLAGTTDHAIVVGTSPGRDGVGAAALLPALVKVLRRQPRRHEFRIVAFGRTKEDTALGAWAYADAMPKDRPPALVVHLGFVGYGETRTAPRTDADERCALNAIAAHLGVVLNELRAEREITRLTSCETRGVGALFCWFVTTQGIADRYAFVGRGLRFAGLTARVGRRASLDATAHYSAYRLLAAYLTAADDMPLAEAASAASADAPR